VSTTSGHRDPSRSGRDREIVELRANGETLQAIASRFGLSRERVRQIVERQRRDRGAPGAGSIDAARAKRRLGLAAERRDEALARWRAGATVGEIAQETGLSVRAVRGLLERHAEEADGALRRVALNRRSRAGALRYSDADLIAAVRRVAAALERVPGAAEYAELARELRLPSLSLIQARLGWRLALGSAGLVSAAEVRAGHPLRWSESDCWEAVARIARSIGHAPSIREYARASRGDPKLPSAATVSQRLGGWSAVRLGLVGLASRPGNAR
jgi:DNA-binding CsgD family transcriptional regulator